MPPVGRISMVGGALPGLFQGRSAAACCRLSIVGGAIGRPVATEPDLETPCMKDPAAFEAVRAARPRAAA